MTPTRPTSPALFALPLSIWDENANFHPQSRGTYNQHRFADAVFHAATDGNTPPLRVRGSDMDATADHLSAILDDCGRRGDYSPVLVEDRAFGL